MSEWIVRVLPLPVRDPFPLVDSHSAELARFRIRIIAPGDRPRGALHGPRQFSVDVGPVRILALDTVNPHGGVGGSLDSDQCAWLVRELDRSRDRYVILATHHGPRTLTSDARAEGAPARVLGGEVVSLLLVHDAVVAWMAGTTHERAGRRHGTGPHGFWELPGATSGMGAPLSGGLSVNTEGDDDGRHLVLCGALGRDLGPHWDIRDPLFTMRSPDVTPVFVEGAPGVHERGRSSALR